MHRIHVRDALTALFETPVSASNVVGRKVLTRVLCNPSINFDKQILDFSNDSHLEAMAAQHGDGTRVCLMNEASGREPTMQSIEEEASGSGSVLETPVTGGKVSSSSDSQLLLTIPGSSVACAHSGG